MIALLAGVVFALRAVDRMVFGGTDGHTTTPAVTSGAETRKLLVPEGYAIRDIKRIVPKVGLIPADYDAALGRASPPTGFLVGGESASTLEGFLFPATYDVVMPANADDFVSQQVQAFSQAFAGVDMRYARKKHLTRYDVLKIASLVEREAVYPPDRAKIAAVIYNRLHAGMPLGIDAAIEYAVGAWRPLTAADLRIDSPFNTRTNHGLPPTPVCNPGLASIRAAAHPAKVRYLYYVAIPGDRKGRQYFTTSFAAFLRFQKRHPQ
jgi:uncharacterized YceG family protein